MWWQEPGAELYFQRRSLRRARQRFEEESEANQNFKNRYLHFLHLCRASDDILRSARLCGVVADGEPTLPCGQSYCPYCWQWRIARIIWRRFNWLLNSDLVWAVRYESAAASLPGWTPSLADWPDLDIPAVLWSCGELYTIEPVRSQAMLRRRALFVTHRESERAATRPRDVVTMLQKFAEYPPTAMLYPGTLRICYRAQQRLPARFRRLRFAGHTESKLTGVRSNV